MAASKQSRTTARAQRFLFVALLFLSCVTPPAKETEVPRSPGTERMAERLAAITKNASPMQNEFMNRERLAILRLQALPTDVAERANAEIRLARQLLRAGESA